MLTGMPDPEGRRARARGARARGRRQARRRRARCGPTARRQVARARGRRARHRHHRRRRRVRRRAARGAAGGRRAGRRARRGLRAGRRGGRRARAAADAARSSRRADIRRSVRHEPWHTRRGCPPRASSSPRSRRSSSSPRRAEGRARLVAVDRAAAGAPRRPGPEDVRLPLRTARIGPYQVATGTDTVSPPPVDGAIVGMDTRLVTRTGAEVPQYEVMLHHIVYTNGGPDGRRRDGACPQRPIFQRFYGTSEELRPLTLPRGYGYKITAARPLAHELDGDEPPVDATATRCSSTASRSTRTRRSRPVMPLWLSVLPCRESPDPQYSVPGGGGPGSTHYRSRAPGSSGRRPDRRDGRSPARRRARPDREPAGLRRGARSTRRGRPTRPPTTRCTRSRRCCTSPTRSTSRGRSRRPAGTRRAGHRLRVTAAYDAERPHMRVMGIAHVYVARERGRPGPVRAAARRRADPRRAVRRAHRAAAGRPHARDARPRRRRAADRPPAGTARAPQRGHARARQPLRVLEAQPVDPAREPDHVALRRRDAPRRDARVRPGRLRQPLLVRTATAGRAASTRPATYRIYCSLHPVYMSQYVQVR